MTGPRVDVVRVRGRMPREPEFGETTTCGGCGRVVVRIARQGQPLGFGEAAYHHVDGKPCGGPG